LGKNEDFFMALWIFRPKTVIFAPGATRFPAFPRCASDGPNLRHFRTVAAATSGGVPFLPSISFVALEEVCRTKPDRWRSMMFGRISWHDTKFKRGVR